ncbi:hypothetical protein J6590_054402 [Homalodisca vitripennis]|nr:hypothetical protein J6590_054402 [Homalodisca vitripennis]
MWLYEEQIGTPETEALAHSSFRCVNGMFCLAQFQPDTHNSQPHNTPELILTSLLWLKKNEDILMGRAKKYLKVDEVPVPDNWRDEYVLQLE